MTYWEKPLIRFLVSVHGQYSQKGASTHVNPEAWGSGYNWISWCYQSTLPQNQPQSSDHYVWLRFGHFVCPRSGLGALLARIVVLLWRDAKGTTSALSFDEQGSSVLAIAEKISHYILDFSVTFLLRYSQIFEGPANVCTWRHRKGGSAMRFDWFLHDYHAVSWLSLQNPCPDGLVGRREWTEAHWRLTQGARTCPFCESVAWRSELCPTDTKLIDYPSSATGITI